jgi:hypothetical protein
MRAMILKSRIILICDYEEICFYVNDYATCVVVVVVDDIYSDGDDVTKIAVLFFSMNAMVLDRRRICINMKLTFHVMMTLTNIMMTMTMNKML